MGDKKPVHPASPQGGAGIMRLSGQRVLVTGAGSGIGREIALLFAREGAALFLADLNPELGVCTATETGGRFLQTDVCSESQGQVLYEAIQAEWGGLDHLIHCAGWGIPGTAMTTSLDDWNRTLAINLTATFLMVRGALSLMLNQDCGGNIVTIASVAGMVGVKERAAYCASKAGVIGLVKAVAVDHVGQNIRINAICPGTVDTPWVDRMTKLAPDPAAMRAQMTARQPMGRLGRPEEIAAAALYLASREAAFITGTTLTIDGGLTAQ